MNRRQFNLSLAAAVALPALPARGAAASGAVVPPWAQAWAGLIARAQGRCSPAYLARQLRLSPQVAQALFDDLVAQGVLRAPSALGVARAANPIDVTSLGRTATRHGAPKWRHLLEDKDAGHHASALAKREDACLGCGDTQPEESPDARAPQSFQGGPEEG